MREIRPSGSEGGVAPRGAIPTPIDAFRIRQIIANMNNPDRYWPTAAAATDAPPVALQ
jgi:hypothetical protein